MTLKTIVMAARTSRFTQSGHRCLSHLVERRSRLFHLRMRSRVHSTHSEPWLSMRVSDRREKRQVPERDGDGVVVRQEARVHDVREEDERHELANNLHIRQYAAYQEASTSASEVCKDADAQKIKGLSTVLVLRVIDQQRRRKNSVGITTSILRLLG
eukprot:CAMPEP_0204917834 /NCGR_PEP_ID=MMETSP1397-20131031/15540_1 /ASSEMBLY_ACC=CAM_ASM_000891 /TAXON_ID=49980 /ORGANISM="Climacostomum Climacostomum virens, Strain Stock W-24" /LENGTH=156 /DNA_ID=CAMNT_0052090811 /DNA_START=789 /DNA_END=1259 /DNA_ORIENTATION=-